MFVSSGSTYDPVFIRLGPTTADRSVVLEGVSADEQVVVSGALSLYAESQKKDRVPVVQSPSNSTGDETDKAAVDVEVSPTTSSVWLLPGGIGVAVLLILGVVFGIRSRGHGSKQD